MASYQTVAVEFEHATSASDTRRVNRAVITVYGLSESAILRELRKQYPDYRDVVILSYEAR